MKLHIGCGTVFLEGWINVDLPGPKCHLATDRPDLVTQYKTTDDQYYAKHPKSIDDLRKGPLNQDYVCDKYGSFDRLPCGNWEAVEILARHSFEHLSLTEARKALDEIDRAMKPGGILRLDVPDHEETLKQYKTTADEFYIRHLLGPRQTDYGYHIMSYTREKLKKLVEEFGFRFEKEEDNIHIYPAFCLRFRKPPTPVAKEYALQKVSISDEWRVLEIGPGSNPWARANAYVDFNDAFLQPLRAQGKVAIHQDIEKAPLPFPDQSFDYVYCAHVLEHMSDPIKAINEITRVAPRGCVVMPHAFKDVLFLFEEGDHKWWVFPPETAGAPIRFMRVDYDRRHKLSDSNMSAAMCRLFRTGPNRLDADQRLLRDWYARVEPDLDVIVHWEGRLPAVILP